MLFRSAATGPRGPAGRGAVRAAALELATALESENTKVTTAARLWHGVALARVGSHDAALTAVDVRSGRPKENALRLFAWVARCGVLAARGWEGGRGSGDGERGALCDGRVVMDVFLQGVGRTWRGYRRRRPA